MLDPLLLPLQTQGILQRKHAPAGLRLSIATLHQSPKLRHDTAEERKVNVSDALRRKKTKWISMCEMWLIKECTAVREKADPDKTGFYGR